MFLIIGVWAVRAGSCLLQVLPLHAARLVLMLLAIMALYWNAGTTDIPTLMHTAVPRSLADLGMAGVLRFVRGERCRCGRFILAAGRACRGADRGLGDPGGDPV